MPKFFDPVNHPKRSVDKVTINPNKVILNGGGSGTINISINGILNTVICTYGGGSYAATATAWVLANRAFYLTKGFVVSNTTTGSASATIVVTPLYGWDTVNRINVTAPTIDTLSATFAGTFEPNLALAKTFQVTLNCATTVKYPKNAVDGDKIRIEFKNAGSFAVTWDTLGVFFVGGTEPTVTTNGYTTVEGVVNVGFYPRRDVITLTGATGTATVTAGRLAKLATFGDSLSDTADDFVTSWATAYAAIGLTVTASSGTLIFVPSTKDANYYPIPTIVGVDTDLSGTVAQQHEGRVQMGTVMLDVKQ